MRAALLLAAATVVANAGISWRSDGAMRSALATLPCLANTEKKCYRDQRGGYGSLSGDSYSSTSNGTPRGYNFGRLTKLPVPRGKSGIDRDLRMDWAAEPASARSRTRGDLFAKSEAGGECNGLDGCVRNERSA